MGYSTDFTGELCFNRVLTGPELAILEKLLNIDIRGANPSVPAHIAISYRDNFSYTQWELNDDYTGIRWDYGEKACEMHQQVNFITDVMRTQLNDCNFGFVGSMKAQGEEIGDVWELVVTDGVATRVDTPVRGDIVQCPHCDEEFMLKGKEN